MRVLLDTNVILDVLLERPPFNADADLVWQATYQGQIAAHVTATTLTDIFYVARKQVGVARALKAVEDCLDNLEVCEVNRQTLASALSFAGSDFEDNLQIACALSSGLDAIVTRNKADFKTAAIAVMEPAELLRQLPPTSAGTPGTPASQS